VLTARYWNTLAREEVHQGVRIVRLKPWFRLSRGVVMPAFPLAAQRLIRQHDVVQIHTPLLESWLVTRLAAAQGKKVLLTHHGDLVMPSRPFDQFVEGTVTWIMRQALRAAGRVTIHTKDYADHSPFLRSFRDKLAYVLPPVKIPEPSDVEASAWRRELGLEGHKLVGFAGRFVEEKGFDYLLQAIPLVLEQVPEARFVYAGEVNVVYEAFFEKWRHLVERWPEHVVLLGLLTDAQRVADFYRMCDVLALPSRTDCFPMVQIESMLCGTPTVVTDIPGLRVPVRMTGMGKLVQAQNVPALAEGIVEVLRHRERYIRPRQEIASIFSLEKAVSVYEELFRSLTQ
jgi:glycosyltransferase involved in cell wall biosynthesis